MMTDRSMVYVGLLILIIGVLVLLATIVLPPNTPVVSRFVCYRSPQEEVVNIASKYSPQKLRIDDKLVKLVEEYLQSKTAVKYLPVPQKIGVNDPFAGK